MTFDQQFWPVVVAVTVLSGIAVGAVLTILRGPWLLGSLIGLPILAFGSIYFLYHLDNKTLRRSFQFAILLSLAAHLLIMVMAAVTNIFGNQFNRPEQPVAQRQVRVIEISDQRASFVWEELNSRDTPEPEVEPTKDAPPTTDVKPQPIPVKETPVETQTPQLTRRKTPQRTVPRQSRELSQLRSQPAKLQPRSSQKMTGETIEVTATPVRNEQPKKLEVTESSSKANEVARTQPVKPDPAAASRSQPTESQAKPQPELARTASASARRATRSSEIAMSPPRPSASSARIRRSESRMPMASRSTPVAETKVAKSTSVRPKLEPSKAAESVTKRAATARQIQPSKIPANRELRSTQTQVAKLAERRPTRTVRPSISNPASVTTEPRRSTTESAVATSPIKVEQPSRSPESQTVSRELKSKTLSVSRSSQGIAGIGRARNLDRSVGGTPSPSVQASDSSRRERTMSRSQDARMLIASTMSETRRASGSVKMPSSAFRADTNAAAKLAGSAAPSEKSVESSAARITAASTSHRDKMSAERGASSVDLGPTKVVNDLQRSRRLSGGGQTEVAQISPESTRRSRDSSNRQPTLAANEALNVAAPRNLSAAPSSSRAIEASVEAAIESRLGGEQVLSADRATALVQGDASDRGETEMARELADSRSKARTEREESGFGANPNEQLQNPNQTGQRESRVAVSPVPFSAPGFGIAKSDGRAEVNSSEKGFEATEAKTELERRSTTDIAGAGTAPFANESPANINSPTPGTESASANRRSGVSDTPDATETTELVDRSGRTRRASAAELNPSSMNAIDLEPGTGAANKSTSIASFESRSVDVERSDSKAMEQTQGIDLDVMAIEGPAGLAERPDEYIGTLARPASRDSEQILPDLKSRFRNREFGGVPTMSPDAVLAKEAFRNRSPAAMAKMAEPSTEAAIQLGLEFLARYQSPDGSWSLTAFDRDAPQHVAQLDSDTAATGLALLAFQGAGYNHREFKYARQLEKAIDWLIENQSDDGGLYVAADKKSNSACRLYSHGIAALALTEAYGMTQDPRLEKPAQRALDYIAATQDGRKGGWRYFDEPSKRSADTSVSGWMMMALHSGRLAGLRVNPTTFDGIEDWLDVAADPDNRSLYRYNPYAVDSKGVSRVQGRRPTPAMTSVGLLMRIYAGWKKDDPRLLAGAEYLLNAQMPTDSTPAQRDTYYWYYATQVLKHIDGPYWDQWNRKLRPLLTRSQEKTGDMAGSWHPYRPVPDRWGTFGGRIYVTSMNLLSLEVRHRLLPIYQQQEPAKLMGIIETGSSVAQSDNLIAPDVDALREIVGQFETVEDRERKMNETTAVPVIDPEVADADVSPGDMLPAVEPIFVPQPAAKVAMSNQRDSDIGEENSDLQPLEADDRIEVEKTTSNASVSLDNARPPVADLIRSQEENPEPQPVQVAMSAKRAAPESRIELADANEKSNLSIQPPANVASNRPRLTLRKAVLPEALPVEPAQSASISMPKEALAGAPDDASGRTPSPTIRYGTIQGSVFLDGEVLAGARIEFIPVDESAKRMIALTNRLGQFSISERNTQNGKGIQIGEYRVSVTTATQSPSLDEIDLLEVIPERYNAESTIKATIEPDQSTKMDLKLETELE